MKKNFLNGLLLMLVSLFATSAKAESVQIANWTFDTGYDVAENVYTPNSNPWAAVGHFWFKDGQPKFVANEAVGNAADYVMTAQSEGRYWQLCEGYQNKVLRIENADANDISDYTDASKHNVYYEIQFPTKGYKNISIEYACAYGANAVASLQTVVSTDGGATWFDGGACQTAANWWIYNVNTVSLSANNKDKVIMRLIAGNTFKSNWNMDYVKVMGEAMEEAKPIEAKDATIAWAFDQGAENPTMATVSVPEAVSTTSWELGSNVTLQAAATAGTETLTKIQPVVSIGRAQEENSYVKYTIIPKKGVKFTPKKLSFNASKFGTSGGQFDVYVVRGEEKVQLTDGFNPERNNTGNGFTAVEHAINGMGASEEKIELWFYIWNLANNKQVGLSDITLTGDFEGTPEAVPVYTLNVKSGMEGAGKIAVNPSGNEFDAGTEITLSVTENFGYHFTSWTDAQGNVVSDKNPYTFEISANTDLTANFDKNNVYALNYVAIDDMGNKYGNQNLVTFLPAGNIVDGVHYYEEGTDVKLTVANNKILSFTGWEDGTTNAERIINMDGEKNVTVNYAVADYIVAWDLYQDQPNSQRAADYRSNSENAGLLSLRNAAGSTTSWLTRGVNNGAEEGRWGARIWKLRSEGWYWEISFSTKGYSNIKFSNGFGHNYNTYSVIKAEYSVDGTNFTEVGTYDIPERGWVDGEFTLPADANNQERVYIRWMPGSEELVGAETDYDGLSIGDIFVLADSEQANDQTAPVLVSSNPANGATGASATGSIVLTFDERVKVGTGNATLNGEEIAPTVTGKTAVFQYAGLDYNKEYSFTLPAGVITDRSGNAYAGTTINFTTMERTQPAARIYDAVVAADGTGDYKTVQEAIDAAPAGRAFPWLIFIKNGEYKGHVDVPSNKPYLHFIGQERDKVIITDDKLCGGDNALHVSVGATVVVNSDNCYFDNLTLENSWGHDKQAGPQALALNTTGDRTVFKNVAMLSYQDTWITPSTSNYRVYAKDCFIEGAVDFIYNSGNIYIDNTTLYINRKSGGYIVAPSHAADVKWGYVFMNCTITAPGNPAETDVWLGRPWHNQPKTVFINTTAEVTIPAAGWYEKMGGLPALWAEYNTMDGDGNPLDLSQRRSSYWKEVDGEQVWVHNVKNVLTAEEAAQYTVKNVLSGSDNWQPSIITESCAAPQAKIEGNKIVWDAVPYAICYVVYKNNEVAGFTTECEFAYEAGAEYKVFAANEQGGLSKASVPGVTDGISSLPTAYGQLPTAIYTLDGKRVQQLQQGINIIKTANGEVKKIIK
ncbi:MAG: Ig-like domain-containing protein [Prevotella sp.]|nr:Ig-like domain-containing protein [Prevotella sp.]